MAQGGLETALTRAALEREEAALQSERSTKSVCVQAAPSLPPSLSYSLPQLLNREAA
jgi:hypothetical protein